MEEGRLQCYCSRQEIRQRDVKQRQRLTSSPSASSLLAFRLMDFFSSAPGGRGGRGGGGRGGSRTQLQGQKKQARVTADEDHLLRLMVASPLSRCRPRLQELLGGVWESGVGAAGWVGRC